MGTLPPKPTLSVSPQCLLPDALKKSLLCLRRACRWREMGNGHAEVCSQLLGGSAPMARCKVLAGAQQDSSLPCGQDLGNRLSACLVIGELDRAAVFVVAVAERLHMLVPGTEALRKLALTPLGMARGRRIANITDHRVVRLRCLLDGLWGPATIADGVEHLCVLSFPPVKSCSARRPDVSAASTGRR